MIAATWDRESFERERREAALTLGLGACLFPAYGIVDFAFEPDLPLGWLRWVGTAVFVACFFVARRATTLAVARGAMIAAVATTGPMIVAMFPFVAHFWLYLVGYSTYFWGMLIVSWPTRISMALCAWHLASVAVVLAGVPTGLDTSDHIAIALVLGSAASVTVLAGYARRDALHRAWVALAELRDAQARLVAQEKQSALGRMLAGLSHEINNPLNIIKNNLDPLREHVDEILATLLVARTVPGDIDRAWTERDLDWRTSDVTDALSSMVEAVARIRQVHGDLRAFIRGDTREMTVASINDGLRATVGLLARRLPHDVRIGLDLGDVPPLPCHPGELNQVWLNLVQNALDAIGIAGTVVVSSRSLADRVEIVVSDDGPGIDPAFRARLFEPFATTKDPGHGTGLGLATSYEIVQRHGGRISCSDAVPRGARFTVELPRPA